MSKYVYFESRDIRTLDLLTPSYKIKVPSQSSSSWPNANKKLTPVQRHVVNRIYKDVLTKLFQEDRAIGGNSVSNMKAHGAVYIENMKKQVEKADSASWI